MTIRELGSAAIPAGDSELGTATVGLESGSHPGRDCDESGLANSPKSPEFGEVSTKGSSVTSLDSVILALAGITARKPKQ